MTFRSMRFAAVLALYALPLSLFAQTHNVARQDSVTRAVGVYEWTGDLAKPAATRLIPISLFLDGLFQDAGEYMARPIPLALEPGNVYEVQESGVARGTLELSYARHLQPAPDAPLASLYDEGWFGYGTYKPRAPETTVALRRIENPRVVSSKDSPDRPHFSSKGSGTASTDASTPPKSGEPTQSDRRAAELGGKSDSNAGDGTAAETKSPTAASKSGPRDPLDDPDRPSLKRHTADEQKKAAKAEGDASVESVKGSLNDDPNRPNLHRGKPASSMTEQDLPRLSGLPANLHQMAAVSDAKVREEHDFARLFQDAGERAAVLTAMQGFARAQLAAYGGVPAAPAPGAMATSRRPGKTRAHQPSARPHAASVASSPQVPLLEEQLKAYTLSYGAAPTFIYTAHTTGEGAALRYVTIVAQGNLAPLDATQQERAASLQPALQSVTDAQHLDRTPWLRLIDAIDADASNRASLLFELRGQSSRQFGLYRVIAAKSEQIYLSGATP